VDDATDEYAGDDGALNPRTPASPADEPPLPRIPLRDECIDLMAGVPQNC